MKIKLALARERQTPVDVLITVGPLAAAMTDRFPGSLATARGWPRKMHGPGPTSRNV